MKFIGAGDSNHPPVYNHLKRQSEFHALKIAVYNFSSCYVFFASLSFSDKLMLFIVLVVFVRKKCFPLYSY